MQNTWIEEFYNETNADNRLRILNDNKDNSELDSFREKLWIARYGKRKPKKDKFVGYLMEMKYLSEGNSVDISGSKRKQLYEIINGLCLLNSDEIQDEKREILFLELKNVFFKFIEVSKNGRGFTSAVFGMGQLSDEGIAKKIAEQISAIAFSTPHAFNLDKEFSILQKAALVAYREKYPNREHFLTK
ncbi:MULTISPECIES: DUF6553 family protein [Eubacterium]|nr:MULTISPECIES: DUF6553 family protein [unclassified Eubacterium (in: firmicutes)]RGG61877.1 hypothetical protein DWW96_13090 [Eubacterium sp. AF17-7]RHR33963.1 hypothetical protein DWX29_08740 [Eubacterium sp. AF19-12LB]